MGSSPIPSTKFYKNIASKRWKKTIIKSLYLSLLVSFSSYSYNKPYLEIGLGVEYGGLGSQIHVPIEIDDFDFFVAVGIFPEDAIKNKYNKEKTEYCCF